MSRNPFNDPLADLFSDAPLGPAGTVSYRTGVIVEWSTTTLANTVRVDNTVLTNLQVKNLAEIPFLEVGSRVSVMCVRYPDGMSSWYIDGRIITPETDEATQVVSSLASGNFYAQSVATTENLAASATNQDLPTPGPEVTFTVGPSGRIMMMISATINLGNTNATGIVTYEASGANVIAPTAGNLGACTVGYIMQSANDALEDTPAAPVILTGLTPGETTIRCKYTATVTAPSHPVFFRNRTLVVVTL